MSLWVYLVYAVNGVTLQVIEVYEDEHIPVCGMFQGRGNMPSDEDSAEVSRIPYMKVLHIPEQSTSSNYTD